MQGIWQLSTIAKVSYTILSKRAVGNSGTLPFHTKDSEFMVECFFCLHNMFPVTLPTMH